MPGKLKSSWIDAAKPVQLAVKQVLSCTMSLHSMSLHTHPSLHSLLKAKCVIYNSIRKACMHHFCLLHFRRGRNKDISPKPPCCTCKHLPTLEGKQALLQVFVVNLKYTVKASYIVCFLTVSSYCICVTVFFRPHSPRTSFSLVSMSLSVSVDYVLKISSCVMTDCKVKMNITD